MSLLWSCGFCPHIDVLGVKLEPEAGTSCYWRDRSLITGRELLQKGGEGGGQVKLEDQGVTLKR